MVAAQPVACAAGMVVPHRHRPLHARHRLFSPVLYPVTRNGFDGIAWTTPWFMAVNYSALATVYLWLVWTKRGPRWRR